MSRSVPEGWNKLKMGIIGTFSTSSINKKSKENEISVSLLNYMDIYQNSVLTNSYPFQQVTAPTKQVTSSCVQNGDVFFTPSSETPNDIGHSAVFLGDSDSLVHSYHTIRFRLNEDDYLDDNYKAYAFKEDTTYEYFLKRATGSTRFTLSLPSFNELEVLAPPLPEQKKIASILTSVDEVIENTQKQIDKLQDLKKATMNELLTKGIGHTEFKDSELGRIPKSWEVQPLRGLSTKVGSGVTPRGGSSVYQDHGIIFIRSQNVHFDGLMLDDVAYISEQIHAGMKGSMVCGGDVLLNITGASIGRCTVVPNDFPEGNVNQHVCIIRPINSLYNKFLGIWLSSDYGQDQIMRFQAGGNREGLNFEQIRSIKIPVPSIQEQEKASEVVDSIQVLISEVQSKLTQTQSLKKSLMQDLLTGKVRVTVN